MEQEHFTINKRVRVVNIASPKPNRVQHVWLCLHGYGQLAVWFARNFAHLKDDQRMIIIPEGPHRFYLQGTEGRVGASWMTKEDRLADIEDQYDYLEELLESHLKNFNKGVRIHVFGFSQGVATAMRWLERTNHNIASLVCWAGSFPPDIDYLQNSAPFSTLNFHACFGDSDPYIPLDKAHSMVNQVADGGIHIDTHLYEGEHKIYRDLLNEVIAACET